MSKFRFPILALLLALTTSLSAQHADTISISHCTTIDPALSARLDARACRLLADKAYLQKIMAEGAEKASYVAEKTLRKVYKKVGFVAR